MTCIISTQNPRIKLAARLRDRRGRQQQGRILIDGLREIERALTGGVQPQELFLCRDMLSAAAADRLTDLLGSAACQVTVVSESVFRHLAFGDRAEGALLVAACPRLDLARIPVAAGSLLAILENVEKPGNLGAIVRTADASGVSGVVATGTGTDVFNPNAIRASLGAIFHVPVAVASTESLLAWLRKHEVAIYAARVDAVRPYTEVAFRLPAALALGSEAHGLTAAWNGPDIVPIGLPMLGIVDSLNVSATAAVLFYEALRQRHSP